MKSLIYIISTLLVINVAAGSGDDIKRGIRKITVNDHYQYLSANQIRMWISNNGDGSHDPATDGSGLYWPGGINGTKTASFEDGLIFGGVYDGEIRVNGNTHRQGLQAGKILPNGVPADPNLEGYRVYKIMKGWENLPPGPERNAREKDYLEWPVAEGAPYIDVNGNGIPDPGVDLPKYIGKETCWYVANDMDPSRSTFTYGTMPMGLEFQTTVFAFDEVLFEDLIFKKYTVINKGINTIQNMYLSYWADVDLGDGNDDYAGCDTLLKMGYVYNGTNADGIYGSPPPAIGYTLLQGPIVPGELEDSAKFLGRTLIGYKNLPLTAFTFYINGNPNYRDPSQGISAGSVEFYNYMQGYIWNGEPFIDPNTQTETKFVLSGDPVSGTGWYQGPGWPGGPAPGDVRHVMSSGPFNMAPGDTQEIIIGIALAIGTSNINSITQLRTASTYLRALYEDDFIVTGINETPAAFSYVLHQNYPNPFNPSTEISFFLPGREFVKLKVYDILGKEKGVLVNGIMDQGNHKISFNPADYNLTSGVYFYRLETAGYTAARKMVYLR